MKNIVIIHTFISKYYLEKVNHLLKNQSYGEPWKSYNYYDINFRKLDYEEFFSIFDSILNYLFIVKLYYDMCIKIYQYLLRRFYKLYPETLKKFCNDSEGLIEINVLSKKTKIKQYKFESQKLKKDLFSNRFYQLIHYFQSHTRFYKKVDRCNQRINDLKDADDFLPPKKIGALFMKLRWVSYK